MSFSGAIIPVLLALCECALMSTAKAQNHPSEVPAEILAVQLPAYWNPSASDMKQGCLDAFMRIGAKQPSLLRPFDILIVLDRRLRGERALRDRLSFFCPQAVVVASVAVSDGPTTISIPTNRVLFSTNELLGIDKIKELLPQGVTLQSMPNDCCSYTADVHTGPATETEHLAEALKKLPAIKGAQVNLVHLTVYPEALNRN